MLTAVLLFFYFRDFARYFFNWGEVLHEKKMARNEVKKCLEWLSQQQEEMEGQEVGRGGQNVTEALKQQKSRTKDIGHFRSTVDNALALQKLSEDAKKELDSNYKTVSALSQRREGCLETVSQIAHMEDLIQGLSIEFDTRAQHLVNVGNPGGQRDTADSSIPLSNEALARASQSCIQAVRVNWRWLSQLMQCAQLHLTNAAAFHQFFHEAEEAEHWMNVTLSRIHLTFDRTKLQGSRTDALVIQNEIKDVLSAFLQWQTKADYLFDKAKNIVPVPQRTATLKEERSVLALTDYSVGQITFIEGEVLFLMDNADRKKWKVRNNAGEVGVVPAVVILIPAPYGPATELALRLRRQLLALWTASVKRLGYQLIAFMLLVFRDWNEEEVSLLQRLSLEDQEELLRVLSYLETSLSRTWQDYGDFQELQERMHRLIMIVEEASEGQVSDSEFLQTVVVQIKTLEDLLKRYQDFWTFWETYKTLVELAKQPELLLVCDKWEQLQYRATAHVVKFWDTNLDLTDGDITKQTASLALHHTPTDVIGDVTIDQEHQATSTETVSTSVSEEQYTYVVQSVLDPRDNTTQLDLQSAIMLGVVDQTQGVYYNPVTGEAMTMKEAMNEGKVMIKALSRQTLSEEKKSYGLLTVKTTRESRPYTILGVKDPVSGQKLTAEEASQQGLLDPHTFSYHTHTGETLSPRTAIERGLLEVADHTLPDTPPATPDVITKTYAVYGVVDQRQKKKVSFAEAVRKGLLNRDTGEYLHNVTQERFPAQQAIMRGFVKARYIADPSKLAIDPRNQIVIQKFESAKKKLMREVRTIRMFKSMTKRH